MWQPFLPRAQSQKQSKNQHPPNWGGGGVDLESEEGKKKPPATEDREEITGEEADKKDEEVGKKALPATCAGKPWEPGQWCISTLDDTDFNTPRGIAATTDGSTLYVTTKNHQIKKLTIDAKGTVTVDTIAGSTKGNADNPIGTLAQFFYPYGIAIDTTGNILYATEEGVSNSIRKITLAPPYRVDRIAIRNFLLPYGIAATSDALYFTGVLVGSAIRKISLPGYAMSIINNRDFTSPRGIASTKDALYVAGTANNSIKKIALPSGTVNTIASSGFNKPLGIALATDGKALFVTDTDNNSIKHLTLNADGKYDVDTIAGNGKAGNTNGIGTSAQFDTPHGIVAVFNTLLYVADSNNNSIRKLEYKEVKAE